MTTATVHRQMIKKDIAAPIKSLDVTRREITFIATHRLPDRTSEVVEPAGVSLTLQTIDGVPGLLGRATFPQGDPDAEMAYSKVKSGLLGAVSIGFLSLEQGPPVIKGQKGVTHLKSELLEVSLTSLPACPSCLIL